MSNPKPVRRFTPSTNYCMIDEAGSREPFGGSKFILADDYDRDIKTLKDERDELQGTFDLQWAADMRAIKQWQAATGKDMEWPDRARMVVWLLERDAEQAKTIERLRDGFVNLIAEFVPTKYKIAAASRLAALEDTHE